MVDDDTTGLSDNALRDRLRRLRGETVSEPVPTPPGLAVPALPAHQMPDLSAYGMQPMEVTVSKDGVYDAIRYEMKAVLSSPEARDRILAHIRANDPMLVPDMFPSLTTDEVMVIDYDSGSQIATFQAVINLEELTKPRPKTAGWPLLIVGRRERADDFARARGLDKKDWRWVRTPRDLLGYAPGTHMRVLDEGHPLSPQELEELLAIARERRFEVEMVTFGPPSGISFGP